MNEFGGMTVTGDNRSTARKPCHCVTLSTTNTTCTCVGMNRGLRGDNLATNHLSHDKIETKFDARIKVPGNGLRVSRCCVVKSVSLLGKVIVIYFQFRCKIAYYVCPWTKYFRMLQSVSPHIACTLQLFVWLREDGDQPYLAFMLVVNGAYLVERSFMLRLPVDTKCGVAANHSWKSAGLLSVIVAMKTVLYTI